MVREVRAPPKVSTYQSVIEKPKYFDLSIPGKIQRKCQFCRCDYGELDRSAHRIAFQSFQCCNIERFVPERFPRRPEVEIADRCSLGIEEEVGQLLATLQSNDG